jgi:hypothetical protein
MMLFIVGLFVGATFGLMFSGLVQGCGHMNYQETDRLELAEVTQCSSTAPELTVP